MVRTIERTAPVHEPGTRTGYHGLTYGFLVGELVQRVTGQPFAQVVRETIAEPLAARRPLHRRAAPSSSGAPRSSSGRGAACYSAVDGVLHGSVAGRELGDGSPDRPRCCAAAARLVGVELDLPSILDALAPRGIGAFDFGAEATLQAASRRRTGCSPRARWRACMPPSQAVASSTACGSCHPPRSRAPRRCSRRRQAGRSSPSTCGGGSATTASSRPSACRGTPSATSASAAPGAWADPTPRARGRAHRQQRDGDAVRRPAHRPHRRRGARQRQRAARPRAPARNPGTGDRDELRADASDAAVALGQGVPIGVTIAPVARALVERVRVGAHHEALVRFEVARCPRARCAAGSATSAGCSGSQRDDELDQPAALLLRLLAGGDGALPLIARHRRRRRHGRHAAAERQDAIAQPARRGDPRPSASWRSVSATWG